MQRTSLSADVMGAEPPPPPLVAALHIVGGQHARLAGALHGAVHPALVDGLSVDDDVSVPEGNLVVVLGRVVVQRPEDALQARGRQWGGGAPDLLWD